MISVIAAAWLLLIAFFDARKQSIPDALSIGFLVFAIVIRAADGSLSLVSLFIATGFFSVLHVLSRGRALGTGDVLLAAGIGALLSNISLVILWIIISYALGAAIITLFFGATILRAIGYA